MIAVQIGANRGNDEFTSLIKSEHVDTLILVEPLSVHNSSLINCYSNIDNKFIENVIITDKENSEEVIYFHKLDGLEYGNNYELASLNKQHSLNIRNSYEEKELIALKLPNLTINNLLDKYNLQNIDLLFIDTEGYDSKIIMSIDFTKFNIREIYYENLHVNAYELRTFLKEKNYAIHESVLTYGWNDRAVKC